MNTNQITTTQIVTYVESLPDHYAAKLADIAREITGAPRTCPFSVEAAACVLLTAGWTVADLRTRWS